jgi:hypothetical protein
MVTLKFKTNSVFMYVDVKYSFHGQFIMKLQVENFFGTANFFYISQH